MYDFNFRVNYKEDFFKSSTEKYLQAISSFKHWDNYKFLEFLVEFFSKYKRKPINESFRSTKKANLLFFFNHFSEMKKKYRIYFLDITHYKYNLIYFFLIATLNTWLHVLIFKSTIKQTSG